MTTYLSRPVFDFDVNWSSAPHKEFSYDLREIGLAFAFPRYERLQSFTTHAIEFEMLLESEAAIKAWDDFTAELKGRLGGFWFPSPFAAMHLEPDISANDQCMIKDQNLRAWVGDHPAQHLAFFKQGETSQYGRVKSVAPVSETLDGRELVLLEDALATEVDDTWYCTKLLYVRIAADEEAGEFYGEGRQIRRVRVVELPLEYSSIETGQVPVFLYEFQSINGANVAYTRFTGLNQDIASISQAFTSFPIRHKDLIKSLRGDREELVLESVYDDTNPLAAFVPFKVPGPVGVKVYETTYATPDTRTLIFTGKVLSVGAEGIKLSAKCAGILDVLGRRFPRFYIQPRCNHFVYDRLCGAIKVQAGGNITYVSGRIVKVDLQNPPFPGRTESAEMNFFALGWIEVGSGATFEQRSIRQSSAPVKYATSPDKWQITLRLDRPLEHAQVGNLMQVIPGCDGAFETCVKKFCNGANYGGHDNIPQTNPSVRAMQSEAVNGNKK